MGRHKCPVCGQETVKREKSRSPSFVVYECENCTDGKVRVWKIQLIEER